MAIPVWVPGQVLSAADVNNWMVPNAVTKLADQNVTSSTALVNDTALVLPVVANAAYFVTFTLAYEGGTINASDLKFQWSIPSGAALALCIPALFFTDGATHGPFYIDQTNVQVIGTSGAGTKRATMLSGSLITAGNGGNLQFKWAQNTSSATATIVHAGSALTLQRTS